MCEPDVFTKSTPRARKEHRCYECGAVIKPGERYEKHSGVWDGSGQSFKICSDCGSKIDAEFKRDPDFYFEYGNLADCILEAQK